MYVAKCSDEWWVAMKFQPNLAIAGSPRNRFRASLDVFLLGGRALVGCGPRKGYQSQINSEYREVKVGSWRAGDEFRTQKGKSPDRPLRSRSIN